MGCKESKHKVATGNIIITPSPSKRHSNIDMVGSNNNVQKIPENPTNAISPVQKQESLKANVDSNSDKGTANYVNAKESKNAKGESYKVDEKVMRESEIVEVFNDEEIKKENVGEELNKEKECAVEGNLVREDSPNNFFSSRKDDETIEGIISEGISGTSVYYTPHKEGASEESAKLENIGEEEKEPVAEIKNETKTEEAGNNVTEGNSVKETEEAADLVEENPSEAMKEAEEAGDLVEENPSEAMKEAEEAGDLVEVEVGVQVNTVKEPAKAITLTKETPIEEEAAGEEKLVEAGINEETRVKEVVDAANATKEEHLVLQEKVANINTAAKAEAVVDTSEQNPVEEEAGPIVEESKGAVNKISSANEEENVTQTSEEDSKTN